MSRADRRASPCESPLHLVIGERAEQRGAAAIGENILDCTRRTTTHAHAATTRSVLASKRENAEDFERSLHQRLRATGRRNPWERGRAALCGRRGDQRGRCERRTGRPTHPNTLPPSHAQKPSCVLSVACAQSIAIIETDKVSLDVKAEMSGIVSAVCVEPGDTVVERQPLFELAQ